MSGGRLGAALTGTNSTGGFTGGGGGIEAEGRPAALEVATGASFAVEVGQWVTGPAPSGVVLSPSSLAAAGVGISRPPPWGFRLGSCFSSTAVSWFSSMSFPVISSSFTSAATEGEGTSGALALPPPEAVGASGAG